MPGYLLHVDDLPISSAESLEEAKLQATTYYQSKLPLKIESLTPPLSRIWLYDYALRDWIVQQ